LQACCVVPQGNFPSTTSAAFPASEKRGKVAKILAYVPTQAVVTSIRSLPTSFLIWQSSRQRNYLFTNIHQLLSRRFSMLDMNHRLRAAGRLAVGFVFGKVQLVRFQQLGV